MDDIAEDVPYGIYLFNWIDMVDAFWWVTNYSD